MGPIAAAEAEQKQARSGAVGVRDAEFRPQIADAGIEGGAVEQGDPASAEARFVQDRWAKGVSPGSNHVVDRSLREASAEDQIGIAAGIGLIRLRIPALEAIVLGDGVVDLYIALIGVIGLGNGIDRIVGRLIVDRRWIVLGGKRFLATTFICDIGIWLLG